MADRALKLVSDTQVTPSFAALARDMSSGQDAVYEFTEGLTEFRDRLVTAFTDREVAADALPDDAPEFDGAGKTESTIRDFVENKLAAGAIAELRALADRAEELIAAEDAEEDEEDEDEEDEEEDSEDDESDED